MTIKTVMRFPIFYALLMLGVCHSSNGATGPIRCWLDDYTNFRFSFHHDPVRRFTLEESSDLMSWGEHWISPVKITDDDGSGYSAGTIEGKARYFIRLKQLPWLFDPVIASSDWLGEFAVAFQPDGKMLFAFQNRTTNSLFLTRQKENGGWDIPELVARTGVDDEPGHYDNNGYRDVRLFVLSNGAILMVCKDEYNGEVICLKRLPNESEWTRHIVSSGLNISIWSGLASALSDDETLAIVFGGSSGSFLYTASAANPHSGSTISISPSLPNGESAVSFSDSKHVLIQMGAEVNVSVDLLSGDVGARNIPGRLLSQAMPSSGIVAIKYSYDNSESGGITIFRSLDGDASWTSNYVRLTTFQRGTASLDRDGKVLVLADWYSRLVFYSHLDDLDNGPMAIRIAAGEEVGGIFQFPNGKYGVILRTMWGGSTVTIACQE